MAGALGVAAAIISVPVGIATFLTGSLDVAGQAVSDAASGHLAESDQYVRKALAGSVVGFLSGASGLLMQEASLGKVLALGYGEGFLGSVATQGLLNENGEIDWVQAIMEGMFSAAMAGAVWWYSGTKVKGVDGGSEILEEGSGAIEGGTDVLDEIKRIDEIKVEFNYNSKYDETEFARQLTDQQNGMNQLTVVYTDRIEHSARSF